jgi:predicted ATP-grasp superfamily ATP-dependent carboligase
MAMVRMALNARTETSPRCHSGESQSQPMRVLVLGDYRQTVTVVRSLGRAGHKVTLATDDPRSPTASSRYVADVWCYVAGSVARFPDQLEARLRSDPTDFVFPVGETALRHLISAAGRLAPLAMFIAPDPLTLERCFDKRTIYTLASRLGVPTPPWLPFTSAEDWRAGARGTGFPVVVKRKDSASLVCGRKAIIVKTPGALDRLLADVESDADTASLIMQKFASGTRHNCHLAAADGHLIAYFQQAVIRTDEPDGTGLGVAGVSVAPSARLREYCELLTQNLAYTGVGCIQFLVDAETGDAQLLEFNARIDSTAALPYRLGYDFPRLAMALAAYAHGEGPCPAPVVEPYPIGKTYHWLRGDLHAWLDCARHERQSASELAAWAVRMLRAVPSSYHLTWEVRDPLPTLRAFWKDLNPRRARTAPAGAKTNPDIIATNRK